MKPWVLLDKLLWKFMRWATGFAVPPLVFIGITPNQLTTLSSIINFSLAAFCFAQGRYRWSLVGLFFLLLHSYFDFADGTLAKATGKTSKLGGWLDSRLDVIGAEAVVVGITFGIVRSNPGLFWLIMAALAIFSRLGVLAMVFDYQRTIYANSEFLDKFRKSRQMTGVDRLIKNLITLEPFPFLFLGTFRYFLPLMVILNQLKWFLLIMAVFNNLRWLVMFWAYGAALSDQKSNLRVIRLFKKYIDK